MINYKLSCHTKIIQHKAVPHFIFLYFITGKEFYNDKLKSFLRQNKISLYSTFSETKAPVIERFNRTLKQHMWRYFTYKNTLRYIDILQDLVKAYNSASPEVNDIACCLLLQLFIK